MSPPDFYISNPRIVKFGSRRQFGFSIFLSSSFVLNLFSEKGKACGIINSQCLQSADEIKAIAKYVETINTVDEHLRNA